ncbi:DEAD/DEAH box helicase family protein [Candidatus Hydrogenedentota bacterium]
MALFHSLFQGREDVYAVRWENKKGRSGYSPACAHEWDPLLCKKPCAKCPNPQYMTLTDDVLKDHLLGKLTVGVYPLRTDEKCHFLAADFDKSGWEADAKAFLETCREMGVPAAIERSRSGKGAHVWIFFSEPISAALARRMGSAILTRAMESRHHIGLDSYDRFFPSQDIMTKGGFGNLIALPLQRSPRKKGNSVFLNEDFEPYPDQWKFLESVQRMTEVEAERLVAKAAQGGKVIGVRLSLSDDSGAEDPWTLPPSRRRSEKPLAASFPSRVSLVRSNLIYVDKNSLPPQALDRLIRIAAFQNPEFYRAQAMRMSTFGKPRIIGCAEEFPGHLALPRGCLDDAKDFFGSNSAFVEEVDEREPGNPLEVAFNGTLRSDQEKAAAKLIEYDDGVLSAPTGFGKTVLAAWLIARRKVNTLILVHRTSLLEQWREQIALFLGLGVKQIGVVGAGRRRTTGQLDVAMLQSLRKKGEVNDVVADYGQVIVDECHHVSAFTFERVMRAVKAKYVLGMTATPIRKDGHHPIIFMQCGPMRVRIHPKAAAAQRSFGHRVLFRTTELVLNNTEAEPSIHEVYEAIVRDEKRNSLIIEDVLNAVEKGRSPLVLTERREHLELLAAGLKPYLSNIFVLRGGMGKKERVSVADALRSSPNSESCVILATGRYAGEGFDFPRLDTLFLTMPISWRGTLQQYVGRLHREHAGKSEVRVYDYVDQDVPMLRRMLAKRMRGYEALGYVSEDLLF